MHMINTSEILETLNMIDHQKLDVRTITMGISLLSCVTDDEDKLAANVYELITRRAEHLVAVGRAIERDFGVPIVNKRVSVTPIALVGASSCRTPEDFAAIARTLDRERIPFRKRIASPDQHMAVYIHRFLPAKLNVAILRSYYIRKKKSK